MGRGKPRSSAVAQLPPSHGLIRGSIVIATIVAALAASWQIINVSSMSAIYASCNTARLDPFCSWLLDGSDGVVWASSVLPAQIEGAGRGMVVRRDVPAGTLLFEVPSSLFLTARRTHSELPALFSDSRLNHAFQQGADARKWALALALCLEPSSSSLAPYLASLPVAVGLPLSFTAAEVERVRATLDGTFSLRYFEATWRMEPRLVDGWLDEARARHPPLPLPSLAKFKWALEIVRSRAMLAPLPDEASGTPDQLVLIPLMDLYNHVYDRPEAGTGAGIEPISLPVPHRGMRFVGSGTSSADGGELRLRFHAPRRYAAGEEVAYSYGEMPNIRFSFLYGFAPRHNPHNFLDIDVPMAELGDEEKELKELRQSLLQEGVAKLRKELGAERSQPHITSHGRVPKATMLYARVATLTAANREKARHILKDRAASHAHEEAAIALLMRMVSATPGAATAAEGSGGAHSGGGDGTSDISERGEVEAAAMGSVSQLAAGNAERLAEQLLFEELEMRSHTRRQLEVMRSLKQHEEDLLLKVFS